MSHLLTAALILGLLCLDSAATDAPSSANDYGRADLGNKPWVSLLHGDGLDGWHASDGPFTPSVWRRDGDAIIVDTGDDSRGRLVQGDGTWAAYEFKVQATIEKGHGPQLVFGISEDGDASHFLTYLTVWKTMVLVRRNEETHEDAKLDVIDFVMEPGTEYDLVLKVRDHSVTSYIDGELINRVTLDHEPRGPVGLGVWGNNTVIRFRDPKVRHYYKRKAD
jgi:hypothetical protein